MDEFTIYVCVVESLSSPSVTKEINMTKVISSSMTILVDRETKKFKVFKEKYSNRIQNKQTESEVATEIGEAVAKYIKLADKK